MAASPSPSAPAVIDARTRALLDIRAFGVTVVITTVNGTVTSMNAAAESTAGPPQPTAPVPEAPTRRPRPPRPPVPPWAKRGRASAGPRPGR
jgi:hypothetical protein